MAPVIVPPLKMVVVHQRGLSQPVSEHEVGWPSHWRLPMIGESLTLPDGSGGTITWIGWDLKTAAVRVTVR